MLLATGQESIINLIVLYTLRHKRKNRNVCVCVLSRQLGMQIARLKNSRS